MTRSGVPLQRLRDRARVSVSPERIAYFRERGLEQAVEVVEVVAAEAAADADQALLDAAAADAKAVTADGKAVVAQDTVNGALAGTEAFTGLLVGAQNVKPFLDETDGAKLVDPAGLDTAIVATAKIAANAVSNSISAYTDGVLALSGTSFVTIQTVSYTTTGEPLEVKANFFLNIHHPAGGGVSARIRIVQALPFGGNLFDQTFAAIGDDFLQGWQTPTVNITRAAGTYTFEVIVSLSNNTSAVETVQSRLLRVEESKR